VHVDPGNAHGSSRHGTPIASVVLEIRGQVKELVIESSIVGAIREVTDDADPCSVGRIVIRDSIVQSLLPDTPAIGTRVGAVELERVTVFGGVTVNRLVASASLIQGLVLVVDNQHGCFLLQRNGPAPQPPPAAPVRVPPLCAGFRIISRLAAFRRCGLRAPAKPLLTRS
jgi:hypothetical protein